jgi:hypothetical protein
VQKIMPHALSPADLQFRRELENGLVPPAAFDHRAHLRLAYGYLVELDDDGACAAMRRTLHAFLARFGIDPAKYHETLTGAWVLAVRHFLASSPPCASADDFLRHNPRLLDTTIMRTHYSAATLASPAARAAFVAPDVDPIPRHAH